MSAHFQLRSLLIIISTAFSISTSSSHFSNSPGTSVRFTRSPTPAFLPGSGSSKSKLPGSTSVTVLHAEPQPQRSYYSDFDTSFEWLAEDRVRNDPERHGRIDWFHPSSSLMDESATDDDDDDDDDDDGIEIRTMPVYPLGAVHIPHSGENYTIVNIEQKNVKMAMDLVNGKWENSLFCATLRARDTNRIASVGTILQLLDTEDRSISGARTWPGNILPTLNRVVANCKAVGVVDILSTEERGECEEEDDYLVARVKVRSFPRGSNNGGDDSRSAIKNMNDGDGEYFDFISKQVVDDYQKVRSIYINSQSLASNELPSYARKAVQTLPTFDVSVVRDETTFWKLVETWQMLCNTIRQSKRSGLQIIVNELSVSFAMKAKGPLELPVKRKSLPTDVQRQLKEIEQNAVREFVELGMDPILDFQEMLSMREHEGRVEKLAGMIRRERSRLEAKESLIRAFLEKELGEELLAISDLGDGQNVFD